MSDNTDDLPNDVVSFTGTDKSTINVRSEVVSARVDAPLGAKILQDGQWLGLTIGTRTDSDPYASALLALDPDQAREIAAALETAADAAEDAAAATPEPDDDTDPLARLREVLSR